MAEVEQALRAELRGQPERVQSSPLAEVACELARRIDAGPVDREVALLSRELRLVSRELRELAGGGTGNDLEAFLERISNPSLRGPGD